MRFAEESVAKGRKVCDSAIAARCGLKSSGAELSPCAKCYDSEAWT